MEHRSLALVLALTMAVPAIAGCVQDLQRRQLDAGWQAEISVDEAPVHEVRGAPAMLVANGTVDLPADANLTLTGFDGELSRENTTIDLQAMRVHADEGTRKVSDAESELSLEADERLQVTFVPADGAQRYADPGHVWNASVEVQWRYRAGNAFDAGRLVVEQNVTPEPVGGLGVGVVEREEGQVHQLVFEAIDVEDVPTSVDVEVLELGGGTVETLDTVEADVNRSDGTARLGFGEPISVPEGSGYLVFRLADVDGTASTALRTAEEPIPAAGGGATVLVLTSVAAVALRRRRR